MRKLVLIAVLGAVALVSATIADAADRVPSRTLSTQAAGGNVPSALLAEMGLADMEVLSDQQGAEVRGSGFFFFHGFHGGFFHPFHHHSFFFHHFHPFFFFHHHGHHHPHGPI